MASQAPTIGRVFVPGGMPELTYVPRTERDLERRLAEVEDNLCKLVVVTGATKTGKTVLVRKVLSQDRPLVWIDGGLIKTEDDFWNECLQAFGDFYPIERNEEQSVSDETGTNSGAKVNLGPVGLNLGGQNKFSTGGKTGQKAVRSGSLRSQAIKQMQKACATLVVDDFHYLERSLQGDIVRALKGAVFEGFAAVVIAIPHRRYDAVRVEREMNGRIESIKVPDWSASELIEIPKVGFPLLRMTISPELSKRLAEEAYGSPHLVQEFCKELARRVSADKTGSVDDVFSDDIFKLIAEHTGKVIFDKLASGPRLC